MIITGIILILLAYFVNLGPFDTLASVLGWILLIIGIVLFILSRFGRTFAGRKYWY